MPQAFSLLASNLQLACILTHRWLIEFVLGSLSSTRKFANTVTSAGKHLPIFYIYRVISLSEFSKLFPITFFSLVIARHNEYVPSYPGGCIVITNSQV